MGTNVSANLRITHVAVRKVTGSQLIITYGRHSDCEKGRRTGRKAGKSFSQSSIAIGSLIWALGTFMRPWTDSYTKAFALLGIEQFHVCVTNWCEHLPFANVAWARIPEVMFNVG